MFSDPSSTIRIKPFYFGTQPFQNQRNLVIGSVVGVMENNQVPARRQTREIDPCTGRHARIANDITFCAFGYCDFMFCIPEGRIVVAVICISVDFSVANLLQSIKQKVFIIYRVYDVGNYREITAGSQGISSHSAPFGHKAGNGIALAGWRHIPFPVRLNVHVVSGEDDARPRSPAPSV